ncbi:hypothetical protein CRT23_26920 [Methylobacterium sp. V23]|nr:hypothetical protein CRT23_26920 [Methylobacterium sp. V23]
MPYVALEDVGTTRRGSLSNRRRLQAWERTGGTCVVCGCRIDGVRDRWIVEHIRALELGGSDEIQNLGPAHEACGREKTRNDHARAAEAKRQKLRHLGAGVIKRPLPGSRASAIKRKIDGTVVLREEHPRSRRFAGPEAGSEEAEAHGSAPIVVDAATNLAERLCPRGILSDREVVSEAVDQMANRATTKAKLNRLSQVDAPASGDVLPAVPAHLDFLFSDRPLLPGEDPDQYETLLRSIVHQIRPADVIEAIWVKNITDLIREANRIRCWRRQILVQAQLQAAEDLIRPALQNADPMGLNQFMTPSANSLAAGWMAGDVEQQAQVDGLLRERGLTAENVAAHGFLLNLPSVERIDRMALLADQRRDALLREIERKREGFGQLARKVAADVFDIERTGEQ